MAFPDENDAPAPEDVGQEWLDALDADAPVSALEHLNGHARIDDRPEVKLGKDMHRVIDEAQRALARDPRVYQRAYELVTVVGAEPSPRDKAPIAKGAPTIRALTAASIIPRFTRFVNFQRYEQPSPKAIRTAEALGKQASGEWKESLPPPNVVAPFLACGEWPEVRTIVGVTETPLFRIDGSIHQTRGYDESTGYLYAPSREYPEIADAPSQDDARRSLAELTHVFCDFPYVDPSHAMVPIAAFLSVLARPAIDGPVPAFLFDASTRGSGKTLQADVVSLLATGRGAARATYPADEEELAKVLMAYALAGCPIVLLDNITRVLGGGVLDAVLTARDDVQFRVLGKNEAPRLPWRTVIFASGNNLVPGEDTMRRVLMARLESDLENPEDRTGFQHPDLFRWVRDERPRFVAAGLTILRAFTCHGRPDAGCKRWGTFEAWSDLIPHALAFAGGADPMGARPTRESGISDELAAHAIVLRELVRLSPDGLSAAEIVRALYPAPGANDPPDGWEELRDAIECWCPGRPGATPDHRALGRRLRQAKGRILNGTRIEARPGHAGAVRWITRRIG